MQCNIDRTGRTLRAVTGAICCVVGVGLVIGVVFGPLGADVLVIALATIAIGIFQLFEARKGWCVLRAVGVKTRY